MNCYVHPGAAAVGVCTYCGQTICGACAVKMGGRLYCKADVESQKLEGRTAASNDLDAPGPTLTAATYFFGLFGLLSVFIAAVLILAGSELGVQQSTLAGIPYIQSYIGAATVTVILIGVVFIFQAVLDILVVFWLGRGNLIGVKVGMILSIMWTAIFVGASIIPGAWALGIGGLAVNLAVLFLLLSAWKELE